MLQTCCSCILSIDQLTLRNFSDNQCIFIKSYFVNTASFAMSWNKDLYVSGHDRPNTTTPITDVFILTNSKNSSVNPNNSCIYAPEESIRQYRKQSYNAPEESSRQYRKQPYNAPQESIRQYRNKRCYCTEWSSGFSFT